MYTDYEIREMPLTVKTYRQRISAFLESNGLRMAEDMDYYAAVFAGDDDCILAGGGLSGNVIKCIAVDENMREEGFSSRLISHLMSHAVSNGYDSVRVFTKPSNRSVFESMSFATLATSEEAILMESGRQSIRTYKDYLSSEREKVGLQKDCDVVGAIVMNANPFTLGHRYLVEHAARQVEHLFIIVVKEDVSLFSYAERLAMIADGCSDIDNVTVCKGSDYQISQTTFPTYFLKRLDDAVDTQITLDLDIFCKHIATALNVSKRFVGSEPADALTSRYNELMSTLLPKQGIEVVEIPRLKTDRVVSASLVRQYIADGDLFSAIKYVPDTTVPFVLSQFAVKALIAELDATPKPGLVDRHDNGAHHDMDYNIMMRSIEALRPYFLSLAKVGFQKKMPPFDTLKQIGENAEKAMLEATKGVNTHKGALFAMGLTIVAASYLLYNNVLRQGMQCTCNDKHTSGECRIDADARISAARLQQEIMLLASSVQPAENTHGAAVSRRYPQVSGALAAAKEGYRLLFDGWLPFYRQHKHVEEGILQTLLAIMQQIDDTNIYHRKGADVAKRVKQEARQMLENFSIDELKAMNERYITDNISPGGAADMLALTVFVDAIAG